MNFIEHIIEPNRLLLVWKDKETSALRIVGELIRENEGVSLRYYVGSEDITKAQENGFNAYPAFPEIDKSYTDNVLETFSRRIPPESREDYNEFLQELRLKPGADLSKFALLGYSEVRLPSDGFAIINPYEDVSRECEFLTEIAGFRYYKEGLAFLKNEEIKIGSSINIEVEPENEYDKNAVKITFENKKIGNINRAQKDAFNRWIKQGKIITAQVEKINGTQDRPSVVLFVKIRG